jgi:excisionase family DNA binding protein
MTGEREYVAPKEYAGRVGVSVQTIYRRIAAGRLPVVRIGRRGLRIHVPAARDTTARSAPR